MKKTFSIVIPVYNNEANLPHTFDRLVKFRQLIPAYDLDVVFVDDGAKDNSRKLLLEFQSTNKEWISVVIFSKNFGQTPATQAGLQASKGDCVGIISCDLQEPLEMFKEMLEAWEKGHDFVLAQRVQREENWLHKKISNIYWTLVRKFAFPDFPAMGYDFCLLDRKIVDQIKPLNEKNTSIFVLIYWFGFRPFSIPIVRETRKLGKSGWKLRNKISFTIDTMIAFTPYPARLLTYSGILIALFSMLFFAVTLFVWLNSDEAPKGWMTITTILSFLSATLLFGMGIISEYLLRILDESRKRPLFVVDEMHSNERNNA